MRSVALAGLVLAGCVALGQGLREPEDRVIHYNESDDLADSVAALQRRMDSGAARLRFEPVHGYLVSLLRLLKIPVSSQGLVFSKTALQTEKVGPRTPRAVYFSDDVYVGWTPGGDSLDISAVDPNKGPMFYTLDQHRTARPRFTRSMQCLQCHDGPKTMNVPGHLLRSVITRPDGYPVAEVRAFVGGHESPLAARWGGWYVTGTIAADAHLGNAAVSQRASPAEYLSAGSDVVALMVLAHQVKMDNLITHANYETRYALDPRETPNRDWAKQRIATAGESLLEYMLFRDEAPLNGPVLGSSKFAKDFQKLGPRDSKGRSLRDFDLKTRMMRYPCSYLIYSGAFNGLPQEMKDYLWRRLSEILTGQDHSRTYATMSADDCRAVLGILRDTKPEFAAWLARH